MSLRLRLWLVVAIIALYVLLRYAAALGLQLIWYGTVHATQVFWVLTGIPVLWFLAGLLVAGLFAFFSLRPFQRSLAGRGQPWLNLQPPLDRIFRMRGEATWLLSRPIAWIGAAVTGIVSGDALASDWRTYLLALHGGSFGWRDPVMHLDAGFYVFRLPALEALASLLATILFFVLVLRLLAASARRYPFADYLRAVRWPLAGLLWLAAVGVWLGRYALLTQDGVRNQSTGQVIVAGAGYYAVHIVLPLQAFLAVVLALAGLILVLLQRRTLQGPRYAAYALGAGLGVWVLGYGLGALTVGNALNRAQQTWERPYMAATIQATRQAFGLAKVSAVSYPGNAAITVQGLKRDEATLQNVRLADPHAFQQVLSQLQTFRQYFAFPVSDVTVDRYFVHGKPMEVILGARELNQGYSLPGTQQSLLQYTHGYGVIAAGVTQFDQEGLPKLLIENMPVQDHLPGTHIVQPRIYYGEATSDPVIAPNALGEFDYPTGSSSALSNYHGPGIPFDRWRLLIALSQGLGYMWQGQTTDASLYLMDRQIFTRVHKIAPWLTLDPKANLVIRKNGRLVWLMDGYTSTSNMPEAEHYQTVAGNVDYLRNSVKVTVDAATGAVHLYAIGKDPIRDAWAAIFPGLIQPISQMPGDIRSHLQYPDGLFRTQASVLARYHVSNLDTFYAGNDNWALPQELYQNSGTPQPMPSEQIVARLPGQQQLQYMRILPFVPPSRPNMVGWLAAQEDGAAYGHLVLYQLASGSLVPGPMQVETEISQNPQISSSITLWDQHGSQVIRGDLLMLPIGGGMLAVEPLYLEASTNAMPELREVIVAYNNQVVMAPTLNGALVQIFPQLAAKTPAKTTTPTPTTAKSQSGLSALIQAIVQVNAQVQADMQAGDWAKFGQDEQTLQQDLAQLKTLAK